MTAHHAAIVVTVVGAVLCSVGCPAREAQRPTQGVAPSTVNAQTLDGLRLEPTAVLGQGYNSKSQTLLNRCLRLDPKAGRKNRWLFSGRSQGGVQMQRVQDEQVLAQSLGFSLSAKAHFGLTSVDASAAFYRESTSTASADSFAFSEEISERDVLLDTSSSASDLLEPAVRDQPGNRLPQVGESFRSTCGDSFVYGIRRGARLFVTIKIEYDSLAAKQSFSAALNFAGGWGSVANSLSSLSSEVRSHAALKIMAHQIGGDPVKLASIFSSNAGQGSGSAASAQQSALPTVITCSLHDASSFASCQSLLGQVVTYAANVFPSQISTSYDPLNSDPTLADLKYFVEPWIRANVFQAPQPYADHLDSSRAKLARVFDEELKQQDLIDQMLDGRVFRIGGPDREKLQAERQKTVDNIRSILGVVDICYSEGSTQEVDHKCDTALNASGNGLLARLEANRTNVSLAELDPKRFGPYCTLAAGDACLRCEMKLSAVTSEVQTFDHKAPTPPLLHLKCEHMPKDALVATTLKGSVAFASFNDDGSHGDWYTYVYVLDQAGHSSPAQFLKGTRKWLGFEVSGTTAVPNDRTVTVQPSISNTQAWPVITTGDIQFNIDFSAVIEAREMIGALGLR